MFHRKMLETLYLKWFLTKKFKIFEKSDFFTFTEKCQNRVFGQL
jgi:hypothetical protein